MYIICVYIHTYTYTYTYRERQKIHIIIHTGTYHLRPSGERGRSPRGRAPQQGLGESVRPIPLLTLSLLTLLESNFPGKSLGNPYGPGNSTPLN